MNVPGFDAEAVVDRLRLDPAYRARYEALLAEYGNPMAAAVWADMDGRYPFPVKGGDDD